MEADKTVDTGLEVSMLTTAFKNELVPMPICRYEVLDGGPTGPLLQFAQIGQQVYHKWTCDSDTVETFCMIVYGFPASFAVGATDALATFLPGATSTIRTGSGLSCWTTMGVGWT